MFKLKAFAAAAALVALAGTHAVAETRVAAVKGSVLVNKGVGYTPVSRTASVKPGDRLMVNPGSTATITFSDGCSVPVKAGSVFTVGKTSPCNFKAQLGGASMLPLLAIGGQLALGAVGIAVAEQANKDDNTAAGRGFLSVP